jgi:hypothetical protein
MDLHQHFAGNQMKEVLFKCNKSFLREISAVIILQSAAWGVIIRGAFFCKAMNGSDDRHESRNLMEFYAVSAPGNETLISWMVRLSLVFRNFEWHVNERQKIHSELGTDGMVDGNIRPFQLRSL